MADTPEEIEKHRRHYWVVGYLLFGCTALTLALGVNLYHEILTFMDFGEPGIDWPDVVLGLAIATFKASLVCLIFMHLNNERGLIYKFLLFTVVFFIGLMALTLFAKFDPIKTVIDAIYPRFS